MNRRMLAILALAAFALASTGAKRKRRKQDDDAPAARPPIVARVTRERFTGGEMIRAVLAGPLIGWAIPANAAGRHALVLAWSDGDAKKLARLDMASASLAGHLDLPATAIGIGAARFADDDEIVIASPDRIDLLGEDEPLVRSVELGRPSLPHVASGRRLCLSTVGALSCFAPGVPAQRIPLPLEVDSSEDGLEITSRAARPIGPGEDGETQFASGPEPFGERRLRTILISAGASPKRSECWSLLPGDEEVLSANYAQVEGKPILAVTTHPRGKLGLFSTRLLRVFALTSDATREGSKPVLAAESGMHLWQSPELFVFDADHDGKDDLVFGYWKGLRTTHLELDTYLSDGKGHYGPKARETEITVDDGERGWLEMADANFDGIPDAFALAGHHVVVHRGKRSSDGRNLLEEPTALASPLIAGAGGGSTSISVGAGRGGSSRVEQSGGARTALADLDGDGRPETILVGDSGGAAVVVVVRFGQAR